MLRALNYFINLLYFLKYAFSNNDFIHALIKVNKKKRINE